MRSIAIGLLTAATLTLIVGCDAPEQQITGGVLSVADLTEQVKRGNIDTVKSAIDADKDLANSRRDDGVPLIYFAATNGHTGIVSYLLDMGADINAKTDYGSALHAAVDGEHLEVVKELLNRGADVNLTDDWQQTPLHNTTQNRSSKIAGLLITGGADVAAKDHKGRTPLHRCKSKPIAEVLIASGAKVNETDSSGYTPLHWAATPREIVDQPTIEYLLDHGADTSAKDNAGLTPRELAIKNDQKSLVAILDAHAP